MSKKVVAFALEHVSLPASTDLGLGKMKRLIRLRARVRVCPEFGVRLRVARERVYKDALGEACKLAGEVRLQVYTGATCTHTHTLVQVRALGDVRRAYMQAHVCVLCASSLYKTPLVYLVATVHTVTDYFALVCLVFVLCFFL